MIPNLLIGLFIGFVSSIPPGPIIITVIQTAINKGKKSATMAAIGSMTAECIVCLVAVGALKLIAISNDQLIFYLSIISTPLLLGIGIYSIVKKHPEEVVEALPVLNPEVKSKFVHLFENRLRWLWVGFSLNIINPLLLPFWILIVTFVKSQQFISPDMNLLILFAVGAGTGHFLFLELISFFSSNNKINMTPKVKRIINRIIGITFIIVAMWQLYGVLKHFKVFGLS